MDRKIGTDRKESVGKYYYRVGEKTCGPVDAELLKQRRYAGELPEETLFWKAGMTGWRFYRSVFDFRAVVGRVVSLLSGVQDSGVEWKGFFSQVWRRHTWTELREVFCAETEPGGLPLPRVNISSPKPRANALENWIHFKEGDKWFIYALIRCQTICHRVYLYPTLPSVSASGVALSVPHDGPCTV